MQKSRGEIPSELLRDGMTQEEWDHLPIPSKSMQNLLDDEAAMRERGYEKRAPDFLEEGAATFRGRNASYGNSYLEAGDILIQMFPGGPPDIDSAEGWNRFAIFMMCFTKLHRYANNLERGGHKDSAHDLMVYAAMLEEVTR